jgi:hypothetical protein
VHKDDKIMSGPTINDVSRHRPVSSDKYKSLITSNFYDRLEEYDKKKQENQEKILTDLTKDITLSPVTNKRGEPSIFNTTDKTEKSKCVPEQYSFKPTINPKTNPTPKSPEEMAYSPMILKEEKIRRIKEKIENEEKSQITFKPTINPVRAKSRIEYDDPNYLTKLKKEEQMFSFRKIPCCDRRGPLAEVEA